MGPEIGNYIAGQIFRLLVIVFIAGIIATVILIFGIPALWEYVKPLLHAATK